MSDSGFVTAARRVDLVTRIIDGEFVILDRARGFVHRLNASASVIWTHCDGASPGQIAQEYAAEVERTPEDVFADVLAALAEFERLGLLADSRPIREP